MHVPGTVLLVENDEAIAKKVHSELESRGHVVLSAHGDDSVSLVAASAHPDIFVLDADLPNAGSQRILNELQRDDRTSDVPVVLLGGGDSRLSWGIGLDTVDKPIDSNVLVGRVEVGLEMHRLRQEIRTIKQNNDVGGLIDEITGLNGGRRLRDELAHHAATVKRYGGHVSIVLLDIDRFESTNEYYGRDAGDYILCEVGQRLLADIRTSDIVGRWRDDQFMAILPCTNALGASFFAERFRQILSEVPVRLAGGESVGVTASFGCAEGNDEVEMVQAAEAAIGTAKRRGRNSVVTSRMPVS